MRGTVPPGVVIPLRSHPDPETFVQIAGDIEGLRESGGDRELTSPLPLAGGGRIASTDAIRVGETLPARTV
jgi:hypothetical protein